jgi:predicted AlkP superfamily pyrophosphatase or phosphodiesterase
MRKFAAVLLCLFTALFWTLSARADAYHAKPKLVVVLVLDQFRGDCLERYRDDFKTANGFNLFLKHGYLTDCYYEATRPEAAAAQRAATGNTPQ